MQTFHNIDGVEIPFNTEWQNVAISLSGGADSALLAYIICNLSKEHNTTIHVINHIRCWKDKPWQQYDFERVYKLLSQMFPNITFKKHTNFISPELEYANLGPTLVDEYGKSVSGDNIEKRAFAEYICYKHNIDAYYNAVTRNPKGFNFNGMVERDIEKTENNKHLEYMIHMGKVASHPFRFVDKSWVLKQYKKLGLMNLFNVTRSCEGTFTNIDYTTYVEGQEVPVCGHCFWCKEREWAIEESK